MSVEPITPLFTKRRAHQCAEPVTNAVEGYSPRGGLAHGSIDRVAYVCPEHIDLARAEYMGDLRPYTAVMKGTAGVDFHVECGEITDWNNLTERP